MRTLCGLLTSACSTSAAPRTGSTPATAVAARTTTPTPPPGAAPTPAVPACAIESLRARSYTGGTITLGARLTATPVYTVYRANWPSQGGTMTGLVDIPSGSGPFSVVVVDHGFIPASVYRPGQDSAKYAGAFAAAGMLTVAPDYPGYAGSSPPEPDLVPIEAEAVDDMDAIGALSSLPQADTRRVAVAGHSNGGGVAELVMVIDPRVRAAALYAPVSTDMADNARRWWVRHPGGTGPLDSPDADPAAYALISPRNYLRAGGPPVLLLQGASDEDIPPEWTAATVTALTVRGVTHREVEFPGAHHNLAGADLVHANALAREWMRGAFSR